MHLQQTCRETATAALAIVHISYGQCHTKFGGQTFQITRNYEKNSMIQNHLFYKQKKVLKKNGLVSHKALYNSAYIQITPAESGGYR